MNTSSAVCRSGLLSILEQAGLAALLALICAPQAYSATLNAVPNPSIHGSIAPELAVLDRGAVLTWLEPEDDQHTMRFAEFNGRTFGAAQTIAKGENWFVNWADTPRLFITPNGDWIAHWLVKNGASTYAYDVVVSRSTDRGTTWSPPSSPHRDGTRTEHGFVSYFADPDGTAHLVWLDGRNTAEGGHHHHGAGPDAMTLRTASMIGANFGPSIELDARVCDCCQTASAVTDAGPIVVYRDRSGSEIRDISIVRRTVDGWSDPALVAFDGWQIAGCPVNGPDVIADGQMVAAAWFTMANEIPAVRLALSNNAGASFGRARTFSSGTALGRVELARIDGGFLMLWMELAGAGATLRLARFDAAGDVHWNRIVAQLDAGRSSGFPRLAVIGNQVLLAWTTSEPDASGKPAPRITTALVDLESTPSG